jgi:hypothetical protein
MRLGINTFVGNCAGPLLPGKFRLDIASDILGNISLQPKDILNVALVGVSPDKAFGRGPNEFGRYPDAVP